MVEHSAAMALQHASQRTCSVQRRLPTLPSRAAAPSRLPNRCRRSPVCAASDRSRAADARPASLSIAAAAVSSLVAESALAAEGLVDPTDAGVSVPTIDIDAAISVAADLIRAAGSAAQQGLNVAGKGAGYAKQAYDYVAPVVKSAADTAAPYVKSAADTVITVAAPALKAAEPTVKGTLSEAEKALSSNGLNLTSVQAAARPATDVAQQAVDKATPFVFRVFDFVTHSDPATLSQYTLAAIATYLFGPRILGGIFGSLRGYAGTVSPAAALDMAASEGNTYIIDLRSSSEKESAGSPDIPNSGRLIELEYATMDDRKLRSQLRNVSGLELQVTVLELSNLKKIGKRSTLLLLDKNGGTSKAVAKELARLGFRKAYVISGGFSGWSSAKLRTKASSSVSSVEVLPPGIGSLTRAVQRGTSRTFGGGRALPSGR